MTKSMIVQLLVNTFKGNGSGRSVVLAFPKHRRSYFSTFQRRPLAEVPTYTSAFAPMAARRRSTDDGHFGPFR